MPERKKKQGTSIILIKRYCYFTFLFKNHLCKMQFSTKYFNQSILHAWLKLLATIFKNNNIQQPFKKRKRKKKVSQTSRTKKNGQIKDFLWNLLQRNEGPLGCIMMWRKGKSPWTIWILFNNNRYIGGGEPDLQFFLFTFGLKSSIHSHINAYLLNSSLPRQSIFECQKNQGRTLHRHTLSLMAPDEYDSYAFS